VSGYIHQIGGECKGRMRTISRSKAFAVRPLPGRGFAPGAVAVNAEHRHRRLQTGGPAPGVACKRDRDVFGTSRGKAERCASRPLPERLGETRAIERPGPCPGPIGSFGHGPVDLEDISRGIEGRLKTGQSDKGGRLSADARPTSAIVASASPRPVAPDGRRSSVLSFRQHPPPPIAAPADRRRWRGRPPRAA